MFVETVVLPRGDWEHWYEGLRFVDDPPAALIASIAWDSGDGEVTGVNVWETPGAIADFFMDALRRSWRLRVSRPTNPSDVASHSRFSFALSRLWPG